MNCIGNTTKTRPQAHVKIVVEESMNMAIVSRGREISSIYSTNNSAKLSFFPVVGQGLLLSSTKAFQTVK